jgi:hypothetical protein
LIDQVIFGEEYSSQSRSPCSSPQHYYWPNIFISNVSSNTPQQSFPLNVTSSNNKNKTKKTTNCTQKFCGFTFCELTCKNTTL